MIIRQAESQFVAIDKSDNEKIYWHPRVYPSWSELNVLRLFPNHVSGQGVEPHFHDGDEYWLFLDGIGEVWLGNTVHPVMHNAIVYTPAGVVHRHQVFTPASVVAAVTMLGGRRRDGHLQLFQKDYGNPTYLKLEGSRAPSDDELVDRYSTGDAFVMGGSENTSAAPDFRVGPLSEFRCLDEGDTNWLGSPSQLERNQFFIVVSGSAKVAHDGFDVELVTGDVGMLEAGSTATIRVSKDSVVIRALGR